MDMEVIVDGAAGYRAGDERGDVLSVVAAVMESLRAKGRSMVSITVDEQSVYPEQLLTELRDKPIAEVSQIRIESKETGVLLHESLTELEDAVKELAGACRELAQIFQSDRPEEGYDPFTKLADIWGFVKSRQILVLHTLGLEPDALELDGKNFSELHRSLNQFLEESRQGLEANDCVLLGDLLEYELAPRAELEPRIVGVLKRRVTEMFG